MVQLLSSRTQAWKMVGLPVPAGMSPLHQAAAGLSGGNLALGLLQSYPGTCLSWRTQKLAAAATPTTLAKDPKQLGSSASGCADPGQPSTPCRVRCWWGRFSAALSFSPDMCMYLCVLRADV